jgi:hypothetical protein
MWSLTDFRFDEAITFAHERDANLVARSPVICG